MRRILSAPLLEEPKSKSPLNMPTTPLERTMWLQGQRCFFCNGTIPKDQASVEHLVPSSLNGSDHQENLVACCKTLNGIFGSMNVKEKIRAILKQNGKFTCPNQPPQPQKPALSVSREPKPTQG